MSRNNGYKLTQWDVGFEFERINNKELAREYFH
jgi:hypothetical protein